MYFSCKLVNRMAMRRRCSSASCMPVQQLCSQHIPAATSHILPIPNKSGLPLGFHSQSIKGADEKQATCALCFHCKRHDYYGLCISLGKKIEQIRSIYQCVQNICLCCSNQCPLCHLKEKGWLFHISSTEGLMRHKWVLRKLSSQVNVQTPKQILCIWGRS